MAGAGNDTAEGVGSNPGGKTEEWEKLREGKLKCCMRVERLSTTLRRFRIAIFPSRSFESSTPCVSASAQRQPRKGSSRSHAIVFLRHAHLYPYFRVPLTTSFCCTKIMSSRRHRKAAKGPQGPPGLRVLEGSFLRHWLSIILPVECSV